MCWKVSMLSKGFVPNMLKMIIWILNVKTYRISKVTSRDSHGVSNQWQLGWLVNGLLDIAPKKTQKLCVTTLWWGDESIPLTKHIKNSNAESVSMLTHWGRDKMDAISQTTFSNAFSWMKMFEFRLQFHWSLFPRVQLTIFQQWFG